MSTAERRAREKDERRREILRAAIRCFRQRGYEGTTLDQVAREAEIAKGTIYLYFPSKADLFATLLLEHGFDVFERALPEDGGLAGFARTYRQLVLEGRREIFDFFLELERGGISDELRVEGHQRLQRILSRLAELVGRKRAVVLWALCIGVAHLARGEPLLDVKPEQVLEEGISLLCK